MPSRPQRMAVLDVEGVLTPEVWIAVAERTGIDFLRRTTRDEPDYDVLMKGRIAALDAAAITMTTIMEVVEGLEPLPGARRFLEELQSRVPVVEGDRLADYRLRLPDQKAKAVEAFRSLNYRVAAVGDSYNDLTMLAAADAGILFRAPDNVRAEHPHYPCCTAYEDLLDLLAVDASGSGA